MGTLYSMYMVVCVAVGYLNPTERGGKPSNIPHVVFLPGNTDGSPCRARPDQSLYMPYKYGRGSFDPLLPHSSFLDTDGSGR